MLKKSPRIFIVEDEGIVADDIEQSLLSAGYRVIGVAASGEKAVEMVKADPPDLILMDIRLAGKMTGIEASKLIREENPLPIIYLTAHSDENTLQMAKETVPYGYLLKPFGQRELRASIETALYKSQTEKRIEESERWNRLIVQSSHSAFVSADIAGTISDWNPAAEKLFGWKREEAIGRKLAETLIPEDLREKHYQGMERYLETRQGKILDQLLEMRALHRSGNEVPVELTIVETELKGSPHFFSFIQDITERKSLEVEKRRSEELENFAHITSHDLREPLRTISMFAHLLLEEVQNQVTVAQKEYISNIINGTKRMETLISDLLTYSILEVEDDLNTEEIEFDLIVKNAISNLESAIRASHAKIHFGNLPIVHGHVAQLTQLVQNLIGNSIKFKGLEPPEIYITAEKQAGDWVFSFKDNGIGFEQKYGEKIFGIFKKLHPKDKYAGSGMGLAICKKIIEFHGGRVWVRSSPMLGATFFFSLPISLPTQKGENVSRSDRRRP